MDRRFSYVSITSCTLETKSNIIFYAIGNPKNRRKAKLSQTNEDFFGSDFANLFVKRYHNELQRCSQFYSLASLFNETKTKDKHHSKWNTLKRKYFLPSCRCF